MWNITIIVSNFFIFAKLRASFNKFTHNLDTNPDSRPSFRIRIRPKVTDPYGSGSATLFKIYLFLMKTDCFLFYILRQACLIPTPPPAEASPRCMSVKASFNRCRSGWIYTLPVRYGTIWYGTISTVLHWRLVRTDTGCVIRIIFAFSGSIGSIAPRATAVRACDCK